MDIYEALDALVDKANGTDGYTEDDSWHELADEINNLLNENFSPVWVENIVAYDSDECTAGVICAAWEDEADLHTYNTPWKRTREI